MCNHLGSEVKNSTKNRTVPDAPRSVVYSSFTASFVDGGLESV